MPTGYTAAVQSGTVTEFREFALRCARGMGACIMQRDDDSDDPPKVPELETFYETRANEAKSELERLLNMSTEEIATAFREVDEDSKNHHRERVEQQAAYLARYRTMLDKTKEWEPPTEEHRGLKEFMIQQLQESIKFDCYEVHEPQEFTPETWHTGAVHAACSRLSRALDSSREARERWQERKRWIEQLYASLPATTDTVRPTT